MRPAWVPGPLRRHEARGVSVTLTSMNSYVITPKNPNEQEQIMRFLTQAHLSARVLTDEEKEDIGMMLLMSEVDPKDTVPEGEIRKILAS